MDARENPLLTLQQLGQSVWLDGVTPELIASGEFRRLIEEDGVSGFTASTAAFDGSSRVPRPNQEGTAWRHLTVRNVADAADLLGPAYTRSSGSDGFASLEVSPHLAHDSKGMLEEARELWRAVYRPNVMIGVPGTQAGLPVIRQLTADGINVNVTMVFGINRYWESCDAYCDGLEDRLGAGKSIDRIASVANFPLNPIDARIDSMLETLVPNDPAAKVRLAGKAGIACARMVYQDFKTISSLRRFREMVSRGAQMQRPVWTATRARSPAESATKYIEPLIGPGTVCAMSPDTLAAFREHGRSAPALHNGFAEAEDVMTCLRQLGIECEAVAQELGVDAIAASLRATDGALPAPGVAA